MCPETPAIGKTKIKAKRSNESVRGKYFAERNF
jgi:hypothetical protein